MRRLFRSTLPYSARLDLYKEKKCATGAESAADAWKSYRASKRSAPVVSELKKMAGSRGRCFYCSDSLGADIEHYVPKSVDFGRTFEWSNLLWVCPGCNRFKSAKFPRDEAGLPLLIDPTKVDPWAKLMLITATGLIVSRYYDDDTWDPVGEGTLGVLKNLNHEAVTEGRVRAVRRIREVVSRVVGEGDTVEIRRAIKREILEDDYGVFSWFTRWEGLREEPFGEVWGRWPSLYKRVLRMQTLER